MSLNNAFNKKMANNFTKANQPIHVSIGNCSSAATSRMCTLTDVYTSTLSSCVCTESKQLGKCTSHPGGTHPWRVAALSKMEVSCRPHSDEVKHQSMASLDLF